jgi:hypothetical protein
MRKLKPYRRHVNGSNYKEPGANAWSNDSVGLFGTGASNGNMKGGGLPLMTSNGDDPTNYRGDKVCMYENPSAT